ncbi:hypothetical protein CW304_11820 [Bacillus sp. UFRGS-B20]|nr:hypothetical protein CW304_11820 [Bacillus sp. UFRGS-B20]
MSGRNVNNYLLSTGSFLLKVQRFQSVLTLSILNIRKSLPQMQSPMARCQANLLFSWFPSIRTIVIESIITPQGFYLVFREWGFSLFQPWRFTISFSHLQEFKGCHNTSILV